MPVLYILDIDFYSSKVLTPHTLSGVSPLFLIDTNYLLASEPSQILIFCLILIYMSVAVSRMMGSMIKCRMHPVEIYGKFTENS